MLKLKLQFVEYGKPYSDDGYAKEFTELAYHPDEEGNSTKYQRKIKLKDSLTSFPLDFVSIVLMPMDDMNNFLFAQIHNRREDDVRHKDKATQRPYQQIRYTVLEKQDIQEAFKYGFSLYFHVAERRREKGNKVVYLLHSYEASEIGIEEKVIDLNSPEPDKYDWPVSHLHRFGHRQSEELKEVIQIANDVIKYERAEIRSRGMTIDEKLCLVQDVQRLVFPYKGVISFALDEITEHQVVLQFIDEQKKTA